MSTAAVLHSKVFAELGEKYPEATEEARTAAAREILGSSGALLDAMGNVVFTQAGLRIAPRLAPRREIRGEHDEARLARSEQITARLASLPPVVNGSAREAIRALPKLRENASDEERIRRANEIVAIMQNSGYQEDDPNGSD